MIIGIPRALLYWKRPYFWEEFFKQLGCDVIISPRTNKEIVKMGVEVADPETCFSNKVYWGHVLELDGKCDFVFIPRLKTNEDKLEYCPKFFGLPDLAEIISNTPILSETFDEKKKTFEKNLLNLGKRISKNKKEVERAKKKALEREEERENKRRADFINKVSSEKKKIVLVSHPYNLYDKYVNLRIEERLEGLGVVPIFLDEIPSEESGLSLKPSGSGQRRILVEEIDFHWEFGKEIIEKIQKIFKYNITGGIEISSFQCGCDGVIKEFVEREFKINKIPFLYLIIDEHTGEAGFQTRLEAFIDTL